VYTKGMVGRSFSMEARRKKNDQEMREGFGGARVRWESIFRQATSGDWISDVFGKSRV